VKGAKRGLIPSCSRREFGDYNDTMLDLLVGTGPYHLKTVVDRVAKSIANMAHLDGLEDCRAYGCEGSISYLLSKINIGTSVKDKRVAIYLSI